jgi:rhodanese-related sulfurtransferase
MTITTITAAEARALIENGAHLVDIRERDEHAREKIPGATNLPLAHVETLVMSSRPVIFHCNSGLRTSGNAARLAAATKGAVPFILEGGIQGWRAAGLATAIDRRQPLEVMRQVQLIAGGLVLLGVILGFAVTPMLFSLSALVGAGLMLAGATGWCGMASLLRVMPWNKAAEAG